MAIAFDNSTKDSGSGVSSLTFSHTVSGSDRVLFVQIYWNNSRTVSDVTYDGTSMTLVELLDEVDLGNGENHAVYRLVNPSTGANNVVVTLSGTAGIESTAASYTGADTSTPIGATRTETDDDSSNPYQESLTTTNDNSWVVWATRQYAGGTDSAGTDTALREDHAAIFGAIWADSDAAVSPAGSRTLELSNDGSPQWFSDILIELNESTAVAQVRPPAINSTGSFMMM